MLAPGRYILITAFAIVAVMLGGLALTFLLTFKYGRTLEFSELTTEQQADVAALLGVRFPASTEFHGCLFQQAEQTTMYAAITIPEADWPALLAGSPFAQSPLEANNARLTAIDGMPPWWRPDEFEAPESAATFVRAPRDAGTVTIQTGGPPAGAPRRVYFRWVQRAD